MDIIRTRARLTATTGLVISLEVFLSELAHGSTAIMAAQAFTVDAGFTVAMTSTITDIATSDADTMMMASAAATDAAIAKEETSAVVTNADVTREEISTAAETSMAEAASTVADAGKFHFLAGPKRSPHTR